MIQGNEKVFLCSHSGWFSPRRLLRFEWSDKSTSHNAKYEFAFYLPASWQGYSVLTGQWNGQTYSPATDKSEETEHGPLLVLRNPQWKVGDPQQDIPVLVFTRSQWKRGRAGEFTIFAGGVQSEISHNGNYVFAIHSRFNWDQSVKGAREAEDIVIQNQNANRPHLDSE